MTPALGLQPMTAQGTPPGALAPASNGLTMPPAAPQAPQAPTMSPLQPSVNIGGVLTIKSAAQTIADQTAAAVAALNQEQQAQPVIQGLAGHIRQFFTMAQAAKQSTVGGADSIEQQMIHAVYARRGEYTPQVRAELEQQNSTLIYMMLFSMKCRQAESLLRDVMLGTGDDKPWTLHPRPSPDMPLQYVADALQSVTQEVQQAQAMGLTPTMEDVKQRLRDAREEMDARVMAEARARCERMEAKMETQLLAGNYLQALDQFISDLTTFKTAIIRGPVVRRKARLEWTPQGLQVVRDLMLEWERVDPMMLYPAPWATDLERDPFVHRHRLSRMSLTELIGVDGYSEAAIRQVLDEYGIGGLNNWLAIDAQKAAAEGRQQVMATSGSGLIDALQYFGSASGKMLRDWGLDAAQVPDEAKEYEIEAWLIGNHVIKAVLNQDPLGRRGYYHDSYERVPGVFWGNSMFDLMRDCEQMCNAAARALANNMAISSGPQVVYNVDRLPTGADITNMFPWKVWQVGADPMGSTAPPMMFFQPQSNAAELMAIYEKFSTMADDYTGIPRYMTGVEGTPGAGRTASGLSMMIGNASKIIKQVVGGIDMGIIEPMVERLYQHNMMYGTDDSLKGDAQIVAKGALSLIAKDAAQVRRNEFLQATMNPVDLQITGLDGRAEVLRTVAKGLDMDTDKVVPPVSVIKQRAAQAQIAQAQAMQGVGSPGAMQLPPPQQPNVGGGQQLMNGAPATDNFSPQPQPA